MKHSRLARGQLLVAALLGAGCGGNGDKYPDKVIPETPFRPSIFHGGISYPAGAAPGPVATADIDGDGLPDVVTLSPTREEVRILLNMGAGALAPAVAVSVGAFPAAMALADLNKDGTPDLAIASKSPSGNVAILLNRGRGTFSVPVNYVTSVGTPSITSGYLDGDGSLDLVITSDPTVAGAEPSPGTVTVLLNGGDGTFGSRSVYQVGRSPREATVADLDGDGVGDVAVANEADTDVSVLLNDGSGALTAGPPVPAGLNFTSIAAADISGDDRADLLLGGLGVGELVNFGSVRFGTLTRYSALAEVRDITTGNFTNGRISDVAFITRGDLVSGLVSLGRSLWEYDSHYFPAGGDIASIAIADVNADGEGDLVTANTSSNDVTVFLNAGRGDFGPGALPARLTASSSLAAADLNGDGEPDWAMTSGTGELAVSFSDAHLLLPLPRPVLVNGGVNPSFVATGDLNGDVRADLAVLNDRATGTVSILLSEGTNAFAAPVPVAAASHYGPMGGPRSVAIGDVDGDGRNDLVVANHPMSGAAGDISVLMNLGDGSFAPPVEYVALPDLTGVAPSEMDDTAVILADLNGDQRADIVLGVWGVNVLLNRGDGTFAPVTHYGKGTIGGAALAAGDMNADGSPDVVFAQPQAIGVLRNDGKGLLERPSLQSIAGGTRLVLADFDDDGRLDMAVTSGRGAVGSVTVLANDGAGTYRVMVRRAVGPTCCLAALDLTGDGKIDLAVGGTTTPSYIFEFRNRGL